MSKTHLLFNLLVIIFLAFNAGTYPLPKERIRFIAYLTGAFLVAGITARGLWGSLT